MIYAIPERNMSTLQRRVEKLQARATRLGLEPIVFRVGASREIARNKVRGQEEYEGHDLVKVYEVEVIGNAPRLNGWSFVATVQHTEEGNILRAHPDYAGQLPGHFRTDGPTCDHCHTNRRRNDTYAVRHDSGEFKRVGRACLCDFIGHNSPESLAAGAEAILGLFEICGDAEDLDWEGGCGSRVKRRFSISRFLEFVASVIRQNGWVSRTAARQSTVTPLVSTSDRALNLMFPPAGYRLEDRDIPTSADIEIATNALEWARTAFENPASDFDHNMKVVANCEGIEFRMAGIAAYIIQGYKRHLSIAEERRHQASVSNHVGVLNARATFTVTLVRSHSFEGAYGVSYLHKFVDASGNHIVWKGSKPIEVERGGFMYEADPGAVVTLVGTVVKHGEYNGVKQTELKRCKLIPMVPTVLATEIVDSGVEI